MLRCIRITVCDNAKACSGNVLLFFLELCAELYTIRGNAMACFCKPYKCVAGFPWSCVQASSHSVTNEGCTKCPELPR